MGVKQFVVRPKSSIHLFYKAAQIILASLSKGTNKIFGTFLFTVI
jgi:hypothetical protein